MDFTLYHGSKVNNFIFSPEILYADMYIFAHDFKGLIIPLELYSRVTNTLQKICIYIKYWNDQGDFFKVCSVKFFSL